MATVAASSVTSPGGRRRSAYAGTVASDYQVRFEWGAAALAERDVDVVIVADHDAGPEGDAMRAAVGALVLPTTLDDADAAAQAVLDEQTRLARRASVLVVAAGDRWPDGSLRPNVADLLVAGRVVDALAACGIDFHSPHAAAACAAAVALRGATNHLVSAERTSRTRTEESE